MQILHPFTGSVRQYAAEISDPGRYRPEHCPQCEAQRPLIAHGFYSRTSGLSGEEIPWRPFSFAAAIARLFRSGIVALLCLIRQIIAEHSSRFSRSSGPVERLALRNRGRLNCPFSSPWIGKPTSSRVRKSR